jgi:type IX secretion system PorP/SprF family membrane protein
MRLILAILLFALAFTVKAQDAHFTQKFNNPLFVNPALTGNGEKVNRLSFLYRDQWRVVPVKYVSTFLNYDRKLFEKNNNKIAAGIQFFYDRAGDGTLSTFNPNVSAAYTRYFNDQKQGISAGFNIGFNQRTIDVADLQFDNQYNGSVFDPNLASGENIAGSGKGMSLGVGINFMTKMGDLSHWDFGASIYNPHRPDFSLIEEGGISDGKAGRPIRYTAYATSELFINPSWSLTPYLHFQQQAKAQEWYTALYFSYYTGTEKTPIKWSLGGGYRVDDAALAYTGLKVKDIQVGFSYDINTSGFTGATNNRGGFELSLKYEWERKKEEKIDSVEIQRDTIYITQIDSNEVEEEEELIEPTEPEIVEVPKDKVQEALNWIQKGMPVKLYFDNDFPNPRSNDTTTNIAFTKSMNEYLMRREAYAEQVGVEVADSWLDTVREETKRLDSLTYFAKELLANGYDLEITFKGHASPLAASNYNLNLSKRRIASVILDLKTRYKGMLAPYFEDGSITIVQNPFGEELAPKEVDDNYNQPKQSVFSPAAAKERRVEIVLIKAVKK